MAHESPLNNLHEQAEASFLEFAPGVPDGGDSGKPAGARVVETFGELEAEYAAIRKGCTLFDWPQRASVRVAGADALDFLDRMLTQALRAPKNPAKHPREAPAAGIPAWGVGRSFWLNRKGRIDADLRVMILPEPVSAIILDTDVLSAPGLVRSLSSFVFSEECTITDVTSSMHRLALHGPRSAELLRMVASDTAGPPLADLGPGRAGVITIAGRRVIADRDDSTGETGFELLMDTAAVLPVYQQLLERGLNSDSIRLRPAGWHAFNIARIEAGFPVFHLDFGQNNLPHESGVLESRVSFTKGCYLGQEVVARMDALGHPKQRLAALRIEPLGREAPGFQPMTGAAVSPPAGGALKPADEGKAVGAVTSSARSPMLGDAIVCFAQVKHDYASPGAHVLVHTQAGPVPATVQPGLAFWRKG
ncbi:MAG: aminomethyl transferase family protein [Phycisphaerales bacterium]|nr:aminomethyl transferase family protein [Phycisphaerales bacterium]